MIGVATRRRLARQGLVCFAFKSASSPTPEALYGRATRKTLSEGDIHVRTLQTARLPQHPIRPTRFDKTDEALGAVRKTITSRRADSLTKKVALTLASTTGSESKPGKIRLDPDRSGENPPTVDLTNVPPPSDECSDRPSTTPRDNPEARQSNGKFTPDRSNRGSTDSNLKSEQARTGPKPPAEPRICGDRPKPPRSVRMENDRPPRGTTIPLRGAALRLLGGGTGLGNTHISISELFRWNHPPASTSPKAGFARRRSSTPIQTLARNGTDQTRIQWDAGTASRTPRRLPPATVRFTPSQRRRPAANLGVASTTDKTTLIETVPI